MPLTDLFDLLPEIAFPGDFEGSFEIIYRGLHKEHAEGRNYALPTDWPGWDGRIHGVAQRLKHLTDKDFAGVATKLGDGFTNLPEDSRDKAVKILNDWLATLNL